MRNLATWDVEQISPVGRNDTQREAIFFYCGIQAQLFLGQFEFSRHALKRAVERNISESEIRQGGVQARIIEDYADDKYAPSCLLLGFTATRRPLHVQVSYVDADLLKIITIYEPDEAEWYDYSRRR